MYLFFLSFFFFNKKIAYLENFENYIALGPSYFLAKYMAFCPSYILPKINSKYKARST